MTKRNAHSMPGWSRAGQAPPGGPAWTRFVGSCVLAPRSPRTSSECTEPLRTTQRYAETGFPLGVYQMTSAPVTK